MERGIEGLRPALRPSHTPASHSRPPLAKAQPVTHWSLLKCTEEQASGLRIPLSVLDDHPRLELAIDG
ncbi:hypothetical protein TorRG33x02_333790 [Trema orientale]|uniref:Uncharacterized protein n=1 Tax=Trema orientale TaxID=63057 RepID=A0A2P5B3Y0_TREOI|nr:hypothetical protein TorRG33x02_333790 [Trema orientale]